MKKKTTNSYAPLFPYLAARENAGLLAEGELVIDNFAGLGGASSGMERALGRPVDHAINHDKTAIGLHRVNHPHSHHSIEDVWAVNPLDITGGQPVALCWFSPTCTHFSKAKGAGLLDRKIRGLAWVALRWAALTRPRVIILENVEEFQTWGPLTKDGRPDPKQKGRTFRTFVNALRYQGYEVEWKELRACDYGSPTIRRRLFLIARRDGQAIVWPDATHAVASDTRVKAGTLKPWRTAAECIDWDLEAPSIFTRKKALVSATMRRIARGIERFVLDAPEPFIVTCNHAGETFRGQAVDQPMKTITAAYDAHGITQPVLAPCVADRHRNHPARSPAVPLSTITTTHNKNELLTPVLAPCVINKQHGNPPRSATDPLSTITTNHNKNEVVSGYLVPRYGERHGQASRVVSVEAPAPTVVTTGNGSRLALPVLIKTDNQKSRTSCTYPVTQLLPTIVSKNSYALVAANLITYYGAKRADEVRGAAMTEPVRTQTTENRHGLVTASLVKHFGGFYQGAGVNVAGPIDTITAVDHHALLAASLIQYNGTAHSQPMNRPMGTTSTVDRFGLSMATLMRQFGTSTAADIASPLGTIVSQGQGKTGLVTADCQPQLSPEMLNRARQVYALLAEYAPQALEKHADHAQELVLVTVKGELYILADIGMRMLTPRELARCQGFNEKYVLEQTAEGHPVSKAAQVRGIGNSVCPDLAAALTTANLSMQFPNAAD